MAKHCLPMMLKLPRDVDLSPSRGSLIFLVI